MGNYYEQPECTVQTENMNMVFRVSYLSIWYTEFQCILDANDLNGHNVKRFYLTLLRLCQDCTSIRPRPFPSTSFTTHYSPMNYHMTIMTY
jgi:hypothetical protein